VGLTKPNNYNDEELKFTAISKSIGHPARERIIELLIEGHLVRNADLPNHLNLSQAMVTKHLDSLRRAKLIGSIYEVHFEILYLEEETLEYYNRKVQEKVDRMKMRNAMFR